MTPTSPCTAWPGSVLVFVEAASRDGVTQIWKFPESEFSPVDSRVLKQPCSCRVNNRPAKNNNNTAAAAATEILRGKKERKRGKKEQRDN